MPPRRLSFLCALALLCVLASATAARAQTATDERAWFVLTLQGPAGADTKWRWFSDTIFRSREGISELEVFSLRGYATYALTPRSAVGGGYVYVRGYPTSGGTLIEHRPFVHYAWTGRTTAGTLTLRTRLEFRFVEGNNRMVTRLRQQVRFSHPFRQGSRLALVGYDEIFFHLNDSDRNVRGVDQNRAFAGISDTVNSTVRFEVGYLNQYAPGHGATARMNHVLSGALAISF